MGIFDLCFFPGTLFSLLPITGTKSPSEGQTYKGLYCVKYFTTEESPSYKTIRVSQQLWLATSLDEGNTENRVGNCFPLLGKLWEFNIVHKFILGAAQVFHTGLCYLLFILLAQHIGYMFQVLLYRTPVTVLNHSLKDLTQFLSRLSLTFCHLVLIRDFIHVRLLCVSKQDA